MKELSIQLKVKVDTLQKTLKKRKKKKKEGWRHDSSGRAPS
jgi:hypothetical protein